MEQGTPETPPTSPRRRRRRIAFLSLVGLPLAALLLLAVIGLINSVDGPPVDDTVLLREPSEPPADENVAEALLPLLETTELLDALQRLPLEDWDDLVQDREDQLPDPQEWQASELRTRFLEFESRFEAQLSQIEAALDRPHYWTPQLQSYGEEGSAPLLSLSSPYGKTAVLYQAEGEIQWALRRSHQLVRLSERVLQCPDGPIQLLVGISSLHSALGLAQSLVRGKEEFDVRSVMTELEEYPFHHSSLRIAMNREYQLWKKTIEELASGAGPWDWSPIDRALFRPNDTLRKLAAYADRAIDEIELGRRAPNPTEFFELDPPPSWISRVASGNYQGMRLYQLVPPGIGNLGIRFLDLQAEREFTLGLLAISLYHADHGRLPDRLEDLVPDYVKRELSDPWTGQALRYDRERRVLWSVGRDREDQGAPAEEQRGRRVDPYLVIPDLR